MTKRIVYEEIPEFDQITQYVIQLPPIELENEIFYGIEVKTIDLSDGFFDVF